MAPDRAWFREWDEHNARIAKERLKASVPPAVSEPDSRPILCERHSYRGPEQPSSSVVVETSAAAFRCPGCAEDAHRALHGGEGPRPVTILPPAEQGWKAPTSREDDAYQKHLAEHREEEIRRGRPERVAPELADAAVARVNATHFAAKAYDALPADEKTRRRARRHAAYWKKHIRSELPGGGPTTARDQVAIEVDTDEYDGPVSHRAGIAYASSDVAYTEWEDNWPRDDRSFVSRWIDDKRRSWQSSRRTPLPEESRVEKIVDALRSFVASESEPAGIHTKEKSDAVRGD